MLSSWTVVSVLVVDYIIIIIIIIIIILVYFRQRMSIAQ